MKNNQWVVRVLVPLHFLLLASCSSSEKGEEDKESTNHSQKKIGVLFVNHGSRSATWRQALVDLETSIKDSVLAGGLIKGTKTAHMEYTEPSIASQLKAFDKEGYTDIIVVPVFLTVSPHTFEDIPTIIGQKEDRHSMEMLKIEKIERYTPKAKTHIAPTLDFTDVLKKNVLRRVKVLSKRAEKEGLVLIGYGDETYEKEWTDLFNTVAQYVKDSTGISSHAYGWCGHIAHYDPQKTTDAVMQVLKEKSSAIVIPVLVAHDPDFQINIIGTGIEKVPGAKEKVFYKPDSILPDENIKSWCVTVSRQYAEKIRAEETQTAQR